MIEHLTRQISLYRFRRHTNRRVTRRRASHRFDRPSVVVYQMGKVGSTSVVNALDSMSLGWNVYHVHFLSQSWLNWAEGVYRPEWIAGSQVPSHIRDAWCVRELLKAPCTHQPWYVISLVRDPVARNVSSFFQMCRFEQASSHQWRVMLRLTGESMFVEERDLQPLVERFIESFPHRTCIDWFDDDFRKGLELDVYGIPFDNRAGCLTYTRGGLRGLVLRMEDLGGKADAALRGFLGCQRVELGNRNVGVEKASGKIYRQFKNQLRLPDRLLNELYDSKYARHFYSALERDRARAKWSTTSVCSV